MIFRPSLKLAKKIKSGKLAEMPLSVNQFSDWSANVFNVGRTQYIILSNTKSLYSCLMLAKGVTNETVFVEQSLMAIDDFLRHDGQSLNVDRLIATPCKTTNFAKALSRAVIGSTNDLIVGAKLLLADDLDRHKVAIRLNETPLKMRAMQAFWTTPDKKKGIRLNLANRLWGQVSYEFLPAFLQVTRNNYGAELARLD